MSGVEKGMATYYIAEEQLKNDGPHDTHTRWCVCVSIYVYVCNIQALHSRPSHVFTTTRLTRFFHGD